MIYVYLQGGLGNQLFQIFTTIAYSLKHKIPFKLPSKKNDLTSPYGSIYKRPLYFENFLSKLKPFLCSNFEHKVLYRERDHSYTKIPVYKDNILLYGYFQSYKYFDEYKNSILKFIDIKTSKTIIKKNQNWNNTISIHFRIGDYIHKTSAHPILSMEYYIKSLRHIIEKTNKDDWRVIYFFEKKDIEQVSSNIAILKEKFPSLIFQKPFENLQDWEEMLSMSCCTHNIIANSTFSWWGAYLNENNDKIVCYPSVWFGQMLSNHCTKDLFLNDWKKI